jgi:chromosome segregation ATPase
MAQNPDDLDEIPSIVPERDELVTHRKRKRGTSASGSAVTAAREPEYVETGTSGWVIFFITILFLGLLATGGGAYYFYEQNNQNVAKALEFQNTLMQIQSRLNLVDQASADSAQELVEKVEFNFSEVDKLWAARNALRQEVSELSTTVAALKTTSGELETTVGNHEKVISDNVAKMQARIDEINRNFAGMDDLGDQLTMLNADLNRTKIAMDAIKSDVEARVSAMEQDIESVNVYRLQTNQTLTNLQNSINSLQSRLGPQ